MGIKDQLDPKQWKALFNAPVAASTYVSSASGGGLEMLKEIMSASRFMQEIEQEGAGGGYGEIVDELLDVMMGMPLNEARAESIQYQSRDPAGMRAEAKQVVVDGAAVSLSLPGGEGYRKWILEMAKQVALTKTGGFLGIGAKSVIDEKEQAALDELAALLGV